MAGKWAWFSGWAAPDPPPASNAATPTDANGKPKKICCACPETKGVRDTCIASKGEEHPECVALIEKHKQCLRAEGFNI
ncbi:cytochrome c oxidase [Pseudoscourfieldia marina]